MRRAVGDMTTTKMSSDDVCGVRQANVPFFSKLLSVKPAALQAIVDEADLLFH